MKCVLDTNAVHMCVNILMFLSLLIVWFLLQMDGIYLTYTQLTGFGLYFRIST